MNYDRLVELSLSLLFFTYIYIPLHQFKIPCVHSTKNYRNAKPSMSIMNGEKLYFQTFSLRKNLFRFFDYQTRYKLNNIQNK